MQIQLPEYFFAESPDLGGAGLIIARDAPCYVLKIFKFSKEEDYRNFLSSHKQSKRIAGYMIAVDLIGVIGGDKNVDPDDLEVAINNAANFYYENKIKVNEKYFKRNALA